MQWTPSDRIDEVIKTIKKWSANTYGDIYLPASKKEQLITKLKEVKDSLKEFDYIKTIIQRVNNNEAVTAQMKNIVKSCLPLTNMIKFYSNSFQLVEDSYHKFITKKNGFQKVTFWDKASDVFKQINRKENLKKYEAEIQKTPQCDDFMQKYQQLVRYLQAGQTQTYNNKSKTPEYEQSHTLTKLIENDYLDLSIIKDYFVKFLPKEQQRQVWRIRGLISQLEAIKNKVASQIDKSKIMFEITTSQQKQDSSFSSLFKMIESWKTKTSQEASGLIEDVISDKKCATILTIQSQCCKQYNQLLKMSTEEFYKQWDCCQRNEELPYPKKIIKQVLNKVRIDYQIPKNNKTFTYLNKVGKRREDTSYRDRKVIDQLRIQKQRYQEVLKEQIKQLAQEKQNFQMQIKQLAQEKQNIQKQKDQQLDKNTKMSLEIIKLKNDIKQLQSTKKQETTKTEKMNQYKSTVENVQKILHHNKKRLGFSKNSSKELDDKLTQSLQNFMKLYHLFNQNQPKILQIQQSLDSIISGLQLQIAKSINGFTLLYRMGNDYAMEDILRKRPNILILAKLNNTKALVGIFHSLSYCKQREGSSQKSIIFTTQGNKFYNCPYTSSFFNVEDNGICICQSSLKISLVSKEFIINFKQLQAKVPSLQKSNWFEFTGMKEEKCDLQDLEIYQVHFNNEEIFTRNIEKLATYVEPDQESPEVKRLKQEVDDLKNTIKQKNNVIMKYKNKQRKVDADARKDLIKDEKDINKPNLQEEQANKTKVEPQGKKIEQKANVSNNYSQTDETQRYQLQRLKIEPKVIVQNIKPENVEENKKPNLTRVSTQALSFHPEDKLNSSKNITQQEQELTALTQRLNSLKQQVKEEEQKKKHLETINENKKAVQAQLKSNKQCLEACKETIETQTAKIADILKNKNEMADELGKINSQIKDKQIKVHQLDARIASLEKKESEQEISEEIKQLQKQRNKLNKELKELKDDIDSNNKFCDDLLEKIQQKEQELKQAEQEYANIGDKKAQLTTLNSELSSKNQELSRLQQELAEVNQSMLRVKEKKIKLQDLCIQLEKNQTELKAEQKQMELEIVQQKKKKSECEKIVTHMKSSELRDHSPPFFVGQCISSATQLLFLQENIQKLCEKRILKTRLVYSFPMMKSLNFHGCVDGIPHYVFILLLENQHLVALYSQEPLSKEQSGKEPGFLASLTNQHIFTLKEQLRHARLNLYDPYYFNIGNSDLRIQLHKYAPVYSNFGSNVCYFDSNGNKSPLPLTGSGEKETDLKAYEVFEVIFE